MQAGVDVDADMDMDVDVDTELLRALLRQARDGTLTEPLGATAWEPLEAGDVSPLLRSGDRFYEACKRLGSDAFRAGSVAVVIVAGGASTRFGGGVKALSPLVDGHTFLELKLADATRVRRQFGADVPVAAMTSDLTHEPISTWLETRGRSDVLTFKQRSLPRLSRNLQIFHTPDGRPSMAPAGHGDVFRALKAGLGHALADRGVRWICFSNVDNVAATLNPLIVGMHRALGRSMTAEVTSRRNPTTDALDAGAAPVRCGGFLALVERVNPADHDTLSTNSMTFDLDAILERDITLPFRLVQKALPTGPVLQFEQITADVTLLRSPGGMPTMPVACVEVPRDPAAVSRFEPVKGPEDLPRVAQRVKLSRAFCDLQSEDFAGQKTE